MSDFEKKVESLKFWMPGVFVAITILLALSTTGFQALFSGIGAISNMIFTLAIAQSLLIISVVTLVFGIIRHLTTKNKYFNFKNECIFLSIVTILILLAFIGIKLMICFNVLNLNDNAFFFRPIKLIAGPIMLLILMILSTIAILIDNKMKKNKGMPAMDSIELIVSMLVINIIILICALIAIIYAYSVALS